MFRLARAHVARKPARARFRKQQLTSRSLVLHSKAPPRTARRAPSRTSRYDRAAFPGAVRRARLKRCSPRDKKSIDRAPPPAHRARVPPFLPLTAPSVPRKFHSRCTLRRSSRAPVARGVHQRRRRLGRESRGSSGTSRPSPRPPSRTRSPRTLDRRRSRLASKISSRCLSPLDRSSTFSRASFSALSTPASSFPPPKTFSARRFRFCPLTRTAFVTKTKRRWPPTPRSRGTRRVGGTRTAPAVGTSRREESRDGAKTSATSPARIIA